MTEPTVIDAEVEDTPADDEVTRPFRVITHKPGVLASFAGFGGTQDAGVTVDGESAGRTLWWMSQDWAVQVLKAGIALPQLLAPTPGWMAALPERFLNRRVGTLRKCDIARYYQKHPQAQHAYPQLVLSVPADHPELLGPQVVLASDLAADVLPADYARLPEDTMLQLDEMLPCVVEVRCWIAHGVVTAAAPYRLGMVGWESSLFLEMLFNAEGQQLTEGAVDTAQVIAKEVDGPPGYALDLGVTVDGIVTVLRVWPAWAAEPLHAELTGAFTALVASHDFDHTNEKWRWTPDLSVYARSTTESPTPEEEKDTAHDDDQP